MKQVKTDTEVYTRRFIRYVENFYRFDLFRNQNLRLKHHHTRRVCEHAKNIAVSIHLPPRDRDLAYLAALFHDIGRFLQISRYRTFNDRLSTDHARLGVQIIKSHDFLSGLGTDEKHLILSAVMLHNRRFLPAGLNQRQALFCRIVRDADKMDILRVLTDYYSSSGNGSNPALDLNLPDLPGISTAVVDDILNCNSVDIRNLHNRNDFRILQIGWIFDLNFTYSVNLLQEKKYISELLDTVAPSKEKKVIEDHIRNYISSFAKKADSACQNFRRHSM